MTANEILDVYTGLEPVEVWKHFAAFNLIPRPSGQESAVLDYVKNVAETHGAPWKSDVRGNVVVYAPATAGHENAPPLIIQAHVDMVCEKRPDVTHDFTVDPIRPRRVASPQGERIYATGTTLGADNGIGAAMALAALTDTSLAHGPLELLFTVEEETGLYGAMELDASLLSARRLINLDSEDPDEITIGCAGGSGMTLSWKIEKMALRPGHTGLRIAVGGLQGGHSGVQIHEPLANAIKLLAHALDALSEHDIPFHVLRVEGGQAHNAIPRDAFAEIALAQSDVQTVRDLMTETTFQLRETWDSEPGLQITVEEIATPESALNRPDDATLIKLLHALPHGVLQFSERYDGKVETSSNLATLRTHELPDSYEVSMHLSIRSFVGAEMERVRTEAIQAAQAIVPNIQIEIRDGYPGWEPNPGALLEATQRVFQRVFGGAAKVEIVHAGLECGIIADKLPGLEAVSFGPLIRGPHTPEEWVDIRSVDEIWKLLAALLKELS